MTQKSGLKPFLSMLVIGLLLSLTVTAADANAQLTTWQKIQRMFGVTKASSSTQTLLPATEQRVSVADSGSRTQPDYPPMVQPTIRPTEQGGAAGTACQDYRGYGAYQLCPNYRVIIDGTEFTLNGYPVGIIETGIDYDSLQFRVDFPIADCTADSTSCPGAPAPMYFSLHRDESKTVSGVTLYLNNWVEGKSFPPKLISASVSVKPSTTPTEQPTYQKEQVKCLFVGSDSEQKCYTETTTPTDVNVPSAFYSCSGVGSCTVDVSGSSGTKLIWKSSCGGYAYTLLDGNSEYAKFDCGIIEQPVMAKEEVTCVFTGAIDPQKCYTTIGTTTFSCSTDQPTTTCAKPPQCYEGAYDTGKTDAAGCVIYACNNPPQPTVQAVSEANARTKEVSTRTYPLPVPMQSCTVTVSGPKGQKVGWQSSCGGSATTFLDGQAEKAVFNCMPVSERAACINGEYRLTNGQKEKVKPTSATTNQPQPSTPSIIDEPVVITKPIQNHFFGAEVCRNGNWVSVNVACEEPTPICPTKEPPMDCWKSGDYVAVKDNNGCVSYECKTEQPPVACPQYMPPSPDWCKDGKRVPSTTDQNGCQGPPQCVRQIPISETTNSRR